MLTLEAEERRRVVEVALTWLSTPYQHQGRVKGVGVDCAQILIKVFSEATPHVPDFDPGYYPPDWYMHHDAERYLSFVQEYAKPIDRQPLPGDIALFKVGRCRAHGGIVIKWPRIIHAVRPSGKVEFDDANKGELAARLDSLWTLKAWT